MSEKETVFQANIMAHLTDDLREYLDFRVRQWEDCLTHDNVALESAAKFLRHRLWEAALNQPPDLYIDIPCAMPPKIQEFRMYRLFNPREKIGGD